MAGLKEYDELGDDLVAVIPLPKGGTLTVSGLALSDISRLVRARSTDLEIWFAKFINDRAALTQGDPKFSEQAATDFGKELLASAPDIAADIIAMASGEPTRGHIARKLPFPAQLEALEAIADLTFVGEDSIKKVVEIVIRMVGGANAALGDLNLSAIGSLASDAK